MRFCPRCATPLALAPRAGRDRLGCPDDTCGYVFWDNPLPVVAALVELNGQIVLVRNAGWPPKFFGLVTGFLERDESPEEGVLRELKEELNLDGEILSFIGVYPFPMRNELIMAWHVRATGEITLDAELEDYKILPAEKLRPWPMGTGLAVADWLARRG